MPEQIEDVNTKITLARWRGSRVVSMTVTDLSYLAPRLAELRNPRPIDDLLAEAMASAGLTPPPAIVWDGKLHRYEPGDVKGKEGKRGRAGGPAWYVAHSDGLPCARFGNWRDGVEGRWRNDLGRELSPSEEMAFRRRMAEAAAARDEEKRKRNEDAADTAQQIWDSSAPAFESHPYLRKKGISPHLARVAGDGRLVLPVFTDNGLSSLQYIAPDGEKLFLKGGKVAGGCCVIGEADNPSTVYLAEGFATAATIHEEMCAPVFVAYSAHNLPAVACQIRDSFPTAALVIVADNDASGTGESYATQARAKAGGRVVIPPSEGDANDFRSAGGDLRALLDPPQSSWFLSADDLCAQPAPLRWLIRGWLVEGALMMVHGESGAGKTFAVLDMCLAIATGQEWQGHRTTRGTVAYLAGEGHHGLRGRVAAWRQEHGGGPCDFFLSRGACSLDTPEGLAQVRDELAQLPTKPAIVVVDTLHRFLAGDENSAKDAALMIRNCAAIQSDFGCAVLLVHHTGTGTDAQGRPRGSSAWRGALDVEIGVAKNSDGSITLHQWKQKDAEEAPDLYLLPRTVPISGWLDEDGAQVSSLVLDAATEPPAARNEPSHDVESVDAVKRAWEDAGRETADGYPYIPRAALLRRLLDEGYTKSSARHALERGKSRLVGGLLVAGVLSQRSHGWVVIDAGVASGWLLGLGGGGPE